MSILIQGGEVITATDRYHADIRCEGEIVIEIGQSLDAKDGEKVIDASGKYVIPGGIDPHVHMALPFMGTVSKDGFESGTRCAIAGGTTTLIDFCIPSKGESLRSALDAWHAKSEGQAHCDYAFHMAITDWSDDIRDEIDMVVSEEGINSFKVFTAYKGALMLEDDQLIKLIHKVKEKGGLITVHAVNGDVVDTLAQNFLAEGKGTPKYHPLCQPRFAEGEATSRVCYLGGLFEQPIYIVHMTCEESVDRLRWAQGRGWKCFGETCTQYFVHDESLYTDDFEGAKYVLSPPLRSKEDQEALWRAVQQGVVTVVGTDHCSFDFKGQKEMGRDNFTQIPNGFNGIEERLKMLHTHGVKEGRIDMNTFVAITSTNAAKLFGLFPKKGTIAVGSDADIVVFDPKEEGVISQRTHQSNCDYNVYEGFATTGATTHTLVRGTVAFEDGEIKVEPGHGGYLKREPVFATL